MKEAWEERIREDLNKFIDDNFQIFWNYSRMDENVYQNLPNNAQEAIKFIIKSFKKEEK
jgi:hypothetical protein